MLLKRSIFSLGLAGAVGVPYLFSSSSIAERFANRPAGAERSADGTAGAYDPARPNEPARAADAVPVVDMREAFRFDVTTAWVLGRWPRVSAGLGELELQGYRVPLVTGTQPDDVAGSLTYYFNRQQRVERITFYGTTGDARRLVAIMAGRFGFVRQLVDDASLYLYEVRKGQNVISELRIKPARVVRADLPHTRFEVSLVIQEGNQAGLPKATDGDGTRPVPGERTAM